MVISLSPVENDIYVLGKWCEPSAFWSSSCLFLLLSHYVISGVFEHHQIVVNIKRGSARPPHKPAAAKFFFGIFLSKMEDHIMKLINPKYYIFLTYLLVLPNLAIFKFLRVDHKNAKK
jgi:hypothetical protein